MRMTERRYDIVLTDLVMPGMDGLEVCRKLRNEARKQTPVLMLTARSQDSDKVVGFQVGAKFLGRIADRLGAVGHVEPGRTGKGRIGVLGRLTKALRPASRLGS